MIIMLLRRMKNQGEANTNSRYAPIIEVVINTQYHRGVENSLEGHKGGINDIVLNYDKVLTASNDETFRIWNFCYIESDARKLVYDIELYFSQK